jgi:hypothetical protein
MAADFPLPGLAGLLGSVHDDLENGRGFVVLAGWPVDDFSHDDTMAAYYMLAAQVGDIVVPNYEGQSVVDVIDENIPYSHLSRGYRSNKRLPFHSDGAGLTALLCLDVAARGQPAGQRHHFVQHHFGRAAGRSGPAGAGLLPPSPTPA